LNARRSAAYGPAMRWATIVVIAGGGCGGLLDLEDPQASDAGVDAPSLETCDGEHWIAYTNLQGIWRVRPDGADVTRVVSLGTERAPVWSPDGRRLLFERVMLDGTSDIWTVDDGTSFRNLTDSPGNDLYGAWSPDGSMISFASDRDGVTSIYTMRTDGTEVTRVASGATRSSWSPDGTRLAVERVSPPPSQIYIVDSLGLSAVNISNSADSHSGPKWSPDGQLIAFGTSDSQIFVMSPNGANKLNITPTLLAQLPVWSPDGERIAFHARDMSGARRDIYTVRRDGSDLVQITDDPTHDYGPVWSPTGDGIAFTSDRDSTGQKYPGDLYATTLGGATVRLTDTADSIETSPSWVCVPRRMP
jgi:Tol biopolymer transport system component